MLNGEFGLILGMPTLLELGQIEQQIQFARSLNLQFIELNLDIPSFQPECLGSIQLKKLATENDLFFTLHLPENLDFGVFQQEIRNGNIDYLKRILAWAREAGINTVVLHLNKGVHFSLPDRKAHLYEQYEAQYLANIKSSFKIINGLAHANKISVCIENMGNFHYHFIKTVLEHILRYENFFLTRDVGHEIRSGGADTAILELYRHKIKHLHLHNANDKSDHLPITALDARIFENLVFAKQQNYPVVIEVKTKAALQKSVEFLRGVI